VQAALGASPLKRACWQSPSALRLLTLGMGTPHQLVPGRNLCGELSVQDLACLLLWLSCCLTLNRMRERRQSEEGSAETSVVVIVTGLFVAGVALLSGYLTGSVDNLTSSDGVAEDVAVFSSDCLSNSSWSAAASVSAEETPPGSGNLLAETNWPVDEGVWHADFDRDGQIETADLTEIRLTVSEAVGVNAGSGDIYVLGVDTARGCWGIRTP